MGTRFRKSVKISKGTKINFSKSGVSFSLGGPGHSYNISGRGTRTTVGIPGTGISYSTYSSNSHKKTSSNSRKVSIPGEIIINMNPDGKIEIQDSNGVIITNPSVIRKIKSMDSYKAKVQELEKQRQAMLKDAYDGAKAENDRFIEIYKLSPNVDSHDQYLQFINSLKPPVYNPQEFEVPFPTEEMIRNQLNQEAINVVHGSIFRIKKLRQEYVEANLQNRMNLEITKWMQDKNNFEAIESEKAQIEKEKFKKEFLKNKQYVNNILVGEENVINEAVENWISSCNLPVEIYIDYEWNQITHEMYLDVNLPSIEDLPNKEVIRLDSGNLREKNKTQNTLRQEYLKLIFGLAIFISANIFNISPAIFNITISGFTQRRNNIGELNNEYLYSIKFTRSIFENSIIQNVDPYKFCMRFENRCILTSTLLLKKIEPYEIAQKK